jgi:hypothetical protein
VAPAATALAALALLVTLLLAIRVNRLRSAQRTVIGEGAERDLVDHARDLERGVTALSDRLSDVERQLGGAITHAAVVRYDAYDEMTGRQSSSIALLDDRRNGIVLSSILHREQARLYAKPVLGGSSEIGLSPEEQAAIDEALSSDGSPSRG